MAERLSAITQQIGFTLWQLQELEGVSAQYFVLLAQAEKGMGIAAGRALVEKAQSKTFGATIHQMAKAGLLTPELEVCFTNLLAERNWLVHKSRATSRSAVHNDSAMHELLLRVGVMAEESSKLLDEITTLIESFIQKHGITERHIAETANRLLERWHATDET